MASYAEASAERTPGLSLKTVKQQWCNLSLPGLASVRVSRKVVKIGK